MNNILTDKEMVNEENAVVNMLRDFLRHAGMDDILVEICCKAMEEEKNGGVCIPLDGIPQDTLERLKDSPLVSSATDGDGLFVLAHNRFYTRRNWCYEQSVRNRIETMAKTSYGDTVQIPADGAFERLKTLQREAIRKMANHPFTIMTGGPGTGKTYTIARAVKLIQEQRPGMRLGLAAPTGKAAARVKEAMLKEAKELELENIPNTTTLHSLLEPNYDFVTFRHNRLNPLPLDWLIVDEASMISLPMMAKLLDALPETCCLTLVGDACQLSSVEPGQVFGDLCKMRVVNENGCKCELKEVSRFADGGEIAALADSIKIGNAEETLVRLKSGRNVHYQCLNVKDDEAEDGAQTPFTAVIDEHFATFCEQRTPEGALKHLNDCRILCVVRKGKFGCEKLNTWVLDKLQKINRNCPIPMMITRNDRNLDVSNGDVGIIMPDQGDYLFLPGNGGSRSIPLSLLPDREMAFASTVHKAQGSEFDKVIIVLSPANEMDADAPVNSLLTRELLYTALTRTKGTVFVFADDESVKRCCENETRRNSGLLDAG